MRSTQYRLSVLLAFVFVGIAVAAFIPAHYAYASHCYDRFVFHWHTLNPMLECMDSEGGSGENTSAVNVGSGVQVFKEESGDELRFRSFVGSSDVSVTNTSNTIVIDYNGSALSDDTVCANVGSGKQVYKDGECNFRTIVGSSDISVTNTSNTIVIDYNGTAGGVSSLTSSNGAIVLNASSGAVLITPKWLLLAQNTTIGGNSSATVTVWNQNSGSVTALNCGTTATTNCSEKVGASSALVGQSFNKITMGLKKANSPTGSATAGVFDSSNNVLLNCGTLNVATLSTSYSVNSFTCPSSYTLSAGEYVGLKVPTQSGANQVHISATTPDVYDTTNSIVSQFTSGAWADASTWDLGSSTTNGAFILERVGSSYIKADFTAKKHLLVTVEMRYNGSEGIIMRLNNDTGANYSVRTDVNGVVSSLTSKVFCDVMNGAAFSSGDRPFLSMWIDNNQSGDRKVVVGDLAYGMDSAATSAPGNVDFSCKWSNTSNQVTSVLVIGKLTSGSVITVWGYD